MKKTNVKSTLLTFGAFLISVSVFAQKGADRGKITDVVDRSSPSSLGMGVVVFLMIICVVFFIILSVAGKKKK